MRRIDRYVWREMVVPFAIGTGAVVLMFQANLLIALYKTMALENVPPAAVAKYVLLKTPFFLNMTLPVGMALAGALAMSRFAREGELMALRSAGASVARVVAPFLAVGVLIALANFWLVERVLPGSERAARTLFQEIGIAAVAPDFKSNVMLSLGSYTASIGTVARVGDTLQLRDVLLIERPRPGETVMYEAESGTYRLGSWRLQKPSMRILRGQTVVTAESTKELAIYEPVSVPAIFQDPMPEERSLTELRAEIANRRKLNVPTLGLETAYHNRFSVPAACLVFALTGPVLAVWFARSGAFVGVLLSLFLVLAYYNAFVISTEILGKNGWVAPLVAAWLPNAIIAALGLFALRRLE